MADIASLGIEVTSKGVAQAEQQLQSLAKSGAQAEQAAQKLAPAVDRVAQAAGRSDAAVSASAAAHARLTAGLAAENGVRDRLSTFLTTQRGQRVLEAQGLQRQSKALSETAISAAQLKAATRGLPAQFTDIATGLASGQRPLQVLLQQGGQLKDMFGGVGAAARSMGGYLLGLLNPYSVAAAAAVGLAAAWREASNEADAFNQALITSGASAVLSVGDLRQMASELDKSTAATAGKASEVITQVVATGRIAADQIKTVAQAAIDLEDATGRSTDATIQDFARLAEAPVEYIKKLNETGGVQRFLTEETLNAVEALDEQGRSADAARVAADAYAKAIHDRSGQITSDLSLWSSFWRNVKKGASEAFDEIVSGFRESAVAQAVFLQSIRNASPSAGAVLDSFASKGGRATPRSTPAASDPYAFLHDRAINPLADAKIDPATQKARDEFERSGLRFATERQRMERDIAEAKKQGVAAGKSQLEIDARIAAIRESYARKAPKGRKPRELSDVETGKSLLEQIRQQIALNEQEAKTQDALTASERLGVTARQQLGRILGTVTGARKKEIEAALAELETSGKLAEALKAEKKANEDLARLKEQLAVGEANQRRSVEIDLLSIGRGRDQVEQLRRELDLRREYEDGLAEIRRNSKDKSAKALADEEAALRDSYTRRLQVERDYQQQRLAEMGKWQNGARAALEDYMAAAQDIAGQSAEIIAGAFSGLEDTLVDFFTKGKADFREFFDSIAADITRFIVRQQLAKLASKLLPGLTGGDESDQAAALSKSAGELAASGVTLIGAASALSASAAALAAAGVASGGGSAGGSTGGGGWVGALLSMFSSSGGRATGGAVSSGRWYGFGERNRPELLRIHGRSYLIPGNRGRVEPMAAGAAAAPVNVTQAFYVQGAPDRRTRGQMAAETGRAATRALSRNGR